MDSFDANWRKRGSGGEGSSSGVFGRLGKRLRSAVSHLTCANTRAEVRTCTDAAPMSPVHRRAVTRYMWPVHGTGLPISPTLRIVGTPPFPDYSPVRGPPLVLVDAAAAAAVAADTTFTDEELALLHLYLTK